MLNVRQHSPFLLVSLIPMMSNLILAISSSNCMTLSSEKSDLALSRVYTSNANLRRIRRPFSALGARFRYAVGIAQVPSVNTPTIDDFRGACAVKGNGAVAGHVKRVDHDDVFDALLFRKETLTRHYFILKFDFSWGIRTNMGKTEGIFLNLQCNCHIVGSIIICNRQGYLSINNCSLTLTKSILF